MAARDVARAAADQLMGSRALLRSAYRTRSGVIRVLAYHDVPSAEAFSHHVEVLARETDPIDVGTVARAALNMEALPKRPVLVTFDDGDPSVLDNALPVLSAAGVPSIAFVVSDLIGTDEPFWWSEVEHHIGRGAIPDAGLPRAADALVRHLKAIPDAQRRDVISDLRKQTGYAPSQRNLTVGDLRTMQAGGMAIGSHTRSHPCLDMCDAQTIRDEVIGAANDLGRMLGEQPAYFAYPNGNVDARARTAVQEAGYTLGFLFDHRLADVRQDPLRLSRLRIDSTDSVARLRAVLSGAHPRLMAIRGRMRERLLR